MAFRPRAAGRDPLYHPVERIESENVFTVSVNHRSGPAPDPGRKLGSMRRWTGNYKLMFIRFVVGGDAEHHRSLTGIITEARLLRDKGACKIRRLG
jgi:hypothetical protein